MTKLRDSRDRRVRDAVVDELALDAMPHDDLVELAAVLYSLVDDWHNVSERPCGTCDSISTVLGRSIGCTRYRAIRSELRARAEGASG